MFLLFSSHAVVDFDLDGELRGCKHCESALALVGPMERRTNPRDEWISVEMIPTYYSAELLRIRWYPPTATLQSSGSDNPPYLQSGGWVRDLLCHLGGGFFGGWYTSWDESTVQSTFYNLQPASRNCPVQVLWIVSKFNTGIGLLISVQTSSVCFSVDIISVSVQTGYSSAMTFAHVASKRERKNNVIPGKEGDENRKVKN